MRIVYFGSGAFGLPTLKRLIAHEEFRVVAAVTQPDRPAGRGGKMAATPVAEYLARHAPEITVLKPGRVNEPEVVAQIQRFQADAFVVIAFGQKLSKGLLGETFSINLHASLLPRWRGAAPINAAILAGDRETGNSVITLADRMDAGLILAQTEPPIEIGAGVTAGELHDVLAADGPGLVEKVLTDYEAGRLRPREQNPDEVTIAGKLSRNDDNFDANQPAEFLRRQVHALTPWPGVSVSILGPGHHRTDVKLLRVEAVREGQVARVEAGSLVDARRGVIACSGGTALRVLEVQPIGKRAMQWGDFVNGAGRLLLGASPPPMVASTREISA